MESNSTYSSDHPKVSIIIPAYNASNYLSEAIESALAQTYKNIEVIVVNDGSKDEGATASIAKMYEGKIRYFEKENGGSSSALNYGIQQMTGEWFSWLSHDDLYYNNKIEKQIDYLNRYDKSGVAINSNVIFSAYELIDKSGNLIKKNSNKQETLLSQYIYDIEHNGYLICEPTKFLFHGCSCLVHKSVFEKVGTFDESLRFINDADMWFRIYSAGCKIHYLPEVLVKGRVHTEQISHKIGFSYHNEEQDMYWNRSLNWLEENYPKEYKLFIKYGCNACIKTRNTDAKKAFMHAKKVNSSCFAEVYFKMLYCRLYSVTREIVKKIYLELKMRS